MKKKLLLLLLLTIILTLTLVGGALNYLIHGFYEERAGQQFQRLYGEVFGELRTYAERTEGMARLLASQEDIVERVSMIHRYADPSAYEPLVFDGEKQALADELAQRARSARMSRLAVYGGEGELFAFYNEGETGYGSYRDDGAFQLMMWRVDGWRAAEPASAMQDGLALHHGDGERYHLHETHLSIAFIAPVLRRFPGGGEERVGYVVAERLVDQSFVSSVIANSGVDFSIQSQSDEAVGTVHALDDGMLRGSTTFNWQHHQAEPPVPHRGEDADHYHAVVSVRVGEAVVYLVGGVDKSMVAAAMEQTNRAVWPVLILSALVILPLGVYVSGRAISRPVAELLGGVESMRHGDYGRRVSPRSDDELGRLALAFNEMAAHIQQRNAEVVESENRYRILVDNVPQKIFYKDRNSVYVSCNRSYADELGIEPGAIAGHVDGDFFSAEMADKYRADDQRIMAAGKLEELEEGFVNEDGRRFVVHTVKSPVRNEQGDVIGILGVFWDITDRKYAEEELKQAAAVFENTADGVLVTDDQLRITMVNRAFSEITGYAADEAVGNKPNFRRSERHDEAFYQTMWQDIERNGSWRGEIWNRRKSGETYPEWMTISTITDDEGRPSHYVAVFSDISAIKRTQDQLDHLAHHDPLTGLPNRLLLDDRLRHAITRSGRHSERVAVLFLDLDRFKIVNDTLGHPVGDRLLRDVAERLKGCLRDADTVARLGGDEFIVLIEEFERLEEIDIVAEKIQHALAAAFHIDDHELYLGVSIGISLYPEDGDDVATLIKNADAAMYRAKESGRNTFQFYTEELTADAAHRLRLEAGLRGALEHGEMELYYQPKVELASGRVVGAEALIRWNHPELGMVPPDQFIPMAEENGTIIEIGAWVLAEAAAQLARWREAGLKLEQLAVNISGLQIQRGDLVGQVRQALERNGLDAGSLELEITESVLMSHPEQAAEVLDRLRGIGVELAVDDFGTGYSSLSYLKRFPINCLKIDQSFVRDIPGDANDTAITKAVIALAHSLQLKVVAEGVENDEQRQLLIGEGCQLAQGYHFSRPLPVAEFEAYCGKQ